MIIWNLIGLTVTLGGLQQIVGVLVAKILSSQGPSTLPSSYASSLVTDLPPIQSVRAIDIFLVQSSTNTIMSHFLSLVAALGMWTWVSRLESSGSDSNE